MLPVTGVVPVLEELTGGRHPGLGEFAKHLFMVTNMLAAVILAPLAGRLSDRLGHRRPMIIAAMLANAVVLTLLARDAPYAIHLLLRFFDGALHITALTLLMTMAADRVTAAGNGRAMGIAGACLTLGVAVGAPLGGLLGGLGAIHVLHAGAGLSLLLAVWVLLLDEAPHQPVDRHQAAPPSVQALPLRSLVLPYVFTFADRLSVGFIISTMTLYMGTVLNAGPATIGILLGSFMLPFAVLTYVFGRLARRLEPVRMMMAGSAAYGLILLILALAPLGFWWGLMPVGGVAAAMMFAPSLILTAEAGGPGSRALAMGGFHAAGSLGFLLGPLAGASVLAIAGWLGAIGWLAAFVVIASLQWLCVLAFLPGQLKARTRRIQQRPLSPRSS
jgi:MFS family permease